MTTRLVVNSSEAIIWTLCPDSCQCNKYCVSVGTTQEGNKWQLRAGADMGLCWSAAVDLEGCHVVHCELWVYQNSTKLHCWLDSRNVDVGRSKISGITRARLLPAGWTCSMKACRRPGETLVRRTSTVCSSGCWNENLAGCSFCGDEGLAVLSLGITEQQWPPDQQFAVDLLFLSLLTMCNLSFSWTQPLHSGLSKVMAVTAVTCDSTVQ